MKCPQCENNHKHSAGMKCSCGYRFCFDPKSNDGMSDGKFLSAIRLASGNDTYYFTKNQFYTALCRRLHRRPWIYFVLAGITVIGTIVLLFTTAKVGACFTGFFVVCFLATGMTFRKQNQARTREASARLLARWLDSGRKIDKLIQSPRLTEPPPEWREPDIYDYGVERLMIVEHDLLVDLLVLNGFHSQERALVISESGYPQYLQQLASKVLQENPEMPIFLLHDATAHGIAMRERVRTLDWLPIEEHPLVDLGLTPVDAQKLHRLAPTNPQNERYAVPVDLLLVPVLTLGLAEAFDQQIPLAMLLDQPNPGTGISGSTHFG